MADLRLEKNNLSNLPDEIGELTCITHLDVSNNQLTSIPETLVGCCMIGYLNLRNNLITEMREWISSLTCLEELNITGNDGITALPFSVGNMEALRELKLSKATVSFPPTDVVSSGLRPMQGYLRRLNQARWERAVDLSGITMETFSAHEKIACIGLTRLILMDNEMTHLDSNISVLVNLEVLNCSSNQLEILPESISHLEKVCWPPITCPQLPTFNLKLQTLHPQPQ